MRTDLQNIILDLVFHCLTGAQEAHGETTEYDVTAKWEDKVLVVRIVRK